MALTPAQLTTLKADIQGNTNQTVIDALAAGANNAIADWYNETASPDWWVYKLNVPIEEVSEAIELDDIANMTTGDNEKLKTFYALRTASGVFPSKASERTGFDDIFSAAAGDDSQQALAALWRRTASNFEKLFSTGTGSNADPATMEVQGPVSIQDIRDALAS